MRPTLSALKWHVIPTAHLSCRSCWDTKQARHKNERKKKGVGAKEEEEEEEETYTFNAVYNWFQLLTPKKKIRVLFNGPVV